uniref:nibrin-like n=1 Tax=Styela clava TaxID=7725 RepID=UPI0019392E73|nr:nibrin-like [Styela clava]
MWCLVTSSDSSQYLLPCNKDIIVGRKDADIVITGDSSVSRKHGMLRITHPPSNLKNPEAIPTITVTDSSKFGTFITRPGTEKIKVNKTAILNPGDFIQFGAQQSIFELQHIPLVVTSSSLENDVKQRLKASILQIGGHFVDSWHHGVTHIVVEKIKLSIKVTQALVYGCHIVEPNYIWKISELLSKTKVTLPSAEQYLPELGEPNLSAEFCSFKVNKQRRSVFSGRTFIYLCKKQLKRLEHTVLGGGGKNVLLNDSSVDDDFLSSSSTSVVHCDVNTDSIIASNAEYEHVQDVLIENEQRFIQEHEIGLAVLYCDAAVYCNPSFDLNSQNTFTQARMAETEPNATESRPFQSDESSIDTVERKRLRSVDNEATTSEKVSPEDKNLAKKFKVDDAPINIDRPFVQENDIISDNISHSCLDDDNLWSQNLDSASFRPDKSVLDDEEISKRNKINTEIELSKFESVQNLPVHGEKPQKQSDSVQPDINENRNTYSSVTEIHSLEVNMDKQSHKSLHSDQMKPDNHIQKMIKKEPNLTEHPPPDNKITSSGYDPSFPTNLSITDIVPLIVKKKLKVTEENLPIIGVKNFKTFRKIWPTYMIKKVPDRQKVTESSPRFPSRIIGGSDFFVNESRNDRSNDIGKWLGCESQNFDPFNKTPRV